MELTLETIESLITLATDNQLAELTVEQDDQKVVIKTGLGQVATSVPVAMAPAPAALAPAASTAPAPAAPAEVASNHYKVTAPMVGTFYRAASPDAPSFVDVGTAVGKGQTLCIIEAMKLMNELECDVTGIVRKICVENGSPVEYGQVLMEIEVS